MTLNPDLDSSWIGNGGEAIGKKELAAPELIYSHYEIATGREAQVWRNSLGNFAVRLTNINDKLMVHIYHADRKDEAISRAKEFVCDYAVG